MTRAEVEAAIDDTPTGDPAAALATSMRWLERYGELDEGLTHCLMMRAGDPSETIELILDHRDAWRAARGLPPLDVTAGWHEIE